MPEQEQTLENREHDASPQLEESRDHIFSQFCEVTDLHKILSSFRVICQEAQIDPDGYENVYTALKRSLTTWKPASIWNLLDKRAALPEYDSQTACRGKRVLVIGAGPVGLRMAIETALLGARVDLVEKRNDFSRNNSLHLWPFLITDLRNLGAKRFYGRFATGSLDHICIRILQGVLMKVCLILGVRVHIDTKFSNLTEPTSPSTGWRVCVQPLSCPVNTFEFDAILAADGKKNSLPGFKLKEFRAKLALAITANFVNGNTQHENSVPEISGVSYVYRMDFFNSLAEKYGIELENIVYYKDETHYFVMTAKKPSLMKKGVLKKDYNDPKQLLSASNIDLAALKKYTTEAASYSTEGALPLDFEKNHRGEDDIALFDFTSLFASENAARIVERKGRKVLLCVAGDSLNEPFWPTGSGCGRGFLGAFDAVWMLKRFCSGTPPLELVEEREALFYLLPQTTPERLSKNLTGYTIDPKTRYPNLSELVPHGDVSYLYDTDNPSSKPPLQQRQPPPMQNTAEPPKEERAAPLVKAASISGGFSHFTKKRSRSTEGLSAIAEATESTRSASPARPTVPSREASPATQNPKPLRNRIEILEAKEKTGAAPVGSQKSKTERKEKDTWQKRRTASSPLREEPKPSSGGEVGKVTASPKSRQRGIFKMFDRSKSKSPSPTPSSEDPTKETEKKERGKVKVVTESPRSHNPTHLEPTHPLSITKQSQATSTTAQPESFSKEKEDNVVVKTEDNRLQEEATESVAAIVKRLNPQQPTTEPSEKSKVKEKVRTEGKVKEKVIKEGKVKEKEKQHPKKSSQENKDKDNESKGNHLRSFFRSKKSYDVAKAGSQTTALSSSPKLKMKKKTKSEREEVHKLSEKPPLSLQGRIHRLKELGVGIETDGPELVLSLDELRDLEVSSGIVVDGGEEREEAMVDVCSRSVSPEYSEEGLESGSSYSRSTSPVHSGAEEVRSQSRVSHTSTGAATYGSSRGVSPAGDWGVGLPSGEDVSTEDDMVQAERKLSVVETVRQLEPLSAACSIDDMIAMRQAQKRRSKEFELAELQSSKSMTNNSNPLWLARIIQGMGKCLERLRKEQNDILATKTTLQIINTILCNVQLHPSDDTYRRVRVSSQRFEQKVWQFSDASQFLARSGWVEIGDYIVLPMGQNVDNAKRVLEKHLNIVNQMLWSQQLELPDSPGVIRALREKQHRVRHRNRTVTAAMIAKRQSYSSRLVTESLQEVEKEQEAMEAVLVRMTSAETRDSSPDTDRLPSHVSEERMQEVHTMKAASAARSKWLERQGKESLEQRKDREYKLILESELYDLPQSSLQVTSGSGCGKSTSPVPSISPSTSQALSVTPDPRSTSPSSTSLTQQETCDSVEVVEERTEKGDIQHNGTADGSSPTPNTAADAQYSTPDSIRQNMMQYEKISLEAAAQVRQKWAET